ncbi:TolC family protein [Zunongwangia sp. F363]|uniref:TolC family protein n=1 Tax=Autumnicola tepida TaxID=3075595 RepID=A0ABU3CBT2_9FLAO|nr:TolC family protein [Zunongwangia sp. F363]MDT0643495.1 TolC family protein [Zunongwangia sp. F363]
MRSKLLLLSALFIFAAEGIKAQEKQLDLEEAVNLALSNSDEAKAAEANINTASNELQSIKNNQYPDFELSGQYMYLTNADVNLQLSTGNGNSQDPETPEGEPTEATTPEINQLMLGQANLSLPVFSGFKLKNSIKAGKNQLNAAQSNAENDKEQLALQTIQNYLNLYKARKTVELIEESLKTAQQRVKDFTAMEQNGLLARNDLLKAQLQESNVRLSLQEARKNAEILNYRLALNLKLPEDTNIGINEEEVGAAALQQTSEALSRSDLEALEFQKEAARDNIKIAQGNYYPSIGLVGGYIALDLENALSVSNAMNIGVGVSYNLADIFKNKSEVKVAKSRAQELEYHLNMMKDQVKLQVKNAQKDYELAMEKLSVYTKSEEQAMENYRIVKDKYDNGLQDTNDLLEADIQQLQSKINLAVARAEISERYYELLRAKGTLINKFSK